MVGIKDFEMPHNCDSCLFFMGENTHCTVGCFVPYGCDNHGEKRPKDCPLIEAIPKTEYEARLKADMVAMLTDLQLEIEELKSYESVDGQDLVMLADIGILFQQKINALKEIEDGK